MLHDEDLAVFLPKKPLIWKGPFGFNTATMIGCGDVFHRLCCVGRSGPWVRLIKRYQHRAVKFRKIISMPKI